MLLLFVMSESLSDIYNKLEYLREYLIKIGPERRQKEIAYKKLDEAIALYSQLDGILSQVNTFTQKKLSTYWNCRIDTENYRWHRIYF